MAFLTSLFRAASVENPRYSLNDPRAVEAFLDGSTTSASGVRVTRESALTHSPWWRGVNLLSDYVAKLPLLIYRRDGEGKERATDHRAYYLLKRKPNEFQTAFDFRKQLTAHAISGGNGYAYISRRGDAAPLELLPLDPDATYSVRERVGTEPARLWYVVKVNNEERKLAPEDVLHIKGLSYDGLQAYSVVEKARDDLGLGIGAKRYATIFFKNSARAPVVLETPARLSPEARTSLRESWERMHQGLDNAHRTAVLDNGLKANQISFNASDSQLIETRNFDVRDIANWLGLPPHKLGDPTYTSRASLEQENQAFLDDSLDPWLVRWEEACWDKLLTEEEKENDTHIVEFLRAALVRADLTARGNYYRTALGGAPWMTRNEIRGLENLNPVDGGDEIKDPLNMGKGGQQNDPGPSKEPPVKPRGPTGADDTVPIEKCGGKLTPTAPDPAAVRAVIEDAAARMVRRLGHAAERAAKDPGKFCEWIETIQAEHSKVFTEAFGPAAMLVGEPAWKLAATILDPLADGLRRLADECTAKQLPERAAQLFAKAEAAMPRNLADQLLSGDEPCTTAS